MKVSLFQNKKCRFFKILIEFNRNYLLNEYKGFNYTIIKSLIVIKCGYCIHYAVIQAILSLSYADLEVSGSMIIGFLN